MKLKPLGDRLIVRAIEEEETTASGLVLPDTAKEKPQKGKVLAAGDGKLDDGGKRIPHQGRIVDDQDGAHPRSLAVSDRSHPAPEAAAAPNPDRPILILSREHSKTSCFTI